MRSACFSHNYPVIYDWDRGEMKFVDIPQARVNLNLKPCDSKCWFRISYAFYVTMNKMPLTGGTGSYISTPTERPDKDAPVHSQQTSKNGSVSEKGFKTCEKVNRDVTRMVWHPSLVRNHDPGFNNKERIFFKMSHILSFSPSRHLGWTVRLQLYTVHIVAFSHHKDTSIFSQIVCMWKLWPSYCWKPTA